MEEYMPPRLSEEEAVLLAMEHSELNELGQWEGLGVLLHASSSDDCAAPPPAPPPPPPPEPPIGWGHAVWESPPRAPPIQLHLWGGWPGYEDPEPQS
jgi:hypothetical protein